MSNFRLDPDEEITVEAEPETLAQIAAQWEADLAEIAITNRPTVNIRPPKVSCG